MNVEHVTWISFASRWTTKKKRKLAVCRCLFREIIKYYECMTTCITEMLTECCAGIRCNELKRSRIRCGSHNDGCILHRSILLKFVFHQSNGRCLLSDSNIDT